jgi:peptide/nickel transport system permease protein
MPGSPLDAYLADPNMTAEMIEFKRQQLGLDQPVIYQYFTWFIKLLQGDLGFSYRTGQAVWIMVKERIGPTLILSLPSIALAVLISIPLGVMAAYKPYSAWDYGSSGLSFIGAAVPQFFLAMLLIYLFCVKGDLPMSGMYDSLSTKTGLLPHLILPMITLSFGQVGSYLRLIRSSMLDTLDDDYIRTARSKGLRESTVIFRHALRNVLIPLVSKISLQLPFIVGGAVIVEQVFSWPGLGSLMVMSINAKDYPTIMGVAIVICVGVLIGNIIVDLIYAILDPRIRLQ